MDQSGSGPRLIIVCGLPGSGKTSLAKRLESSLRAIRFSPDEWMNVLSLDIYDEEARAKIETLQWKFARNLLALGLTVILEWGTWGRSERDTLRLEARALGAAVELHYLAVPVEVLFDRNSTTRHGDSTHRARCARAMVRDFPGTDRRGDGTFRRTYRP